MSARVLVTGAGGFIGGVLVRRLLAHGLDGRPVKRLVAVDVELAGLPQAPSLIRVEGSIAEPGVLERALAEPVDAVFHLAGVLGGAAERTPDLGRRVNVEATGRLLELLRDQGGSPRFVFASTIAVYGDTLPAVVDEATPPAPALSYSAHKLAGEILVADASRRRWVSACSLRLPGVVARPGEGAGLISAFMSQLFWKLEAGQAVVMPVRSDGTAWWISVHACVDNILHAAVVPPDSMTDTRVVLMPAQRLTLSEVVEALARRYGKDRLALVRFEPQEMVQRHFASYPPLATPQAEALGFRHDGSADELVRRALDR